MATLGFLQEVAWPRAQEARLDFDSLGEAGGGRLTQGKLRSGVTARETGLGSKGPGTPGRKGGSVSRIKKTGAELHFFRNCSEDTVGEWQRPKGCSGS